MPGKLPIRVPYVKQESVYYCYGHLKHVVAFLEEPGDAFLDRADPDLIFTGRQRIAGLGEGSEDGGEADGGAWSEGIGQGSSPFSDVRG